MLLVLSFTLTIIYMHFSNGVGIRQIRNVSLQSEVEEPATCLHRGFEDLSSTTSDDKTILKFKLLCLLQEYAMQC